MAIAACFWAVAAQLSACSTLDSVWDSLAGDDTGSSNGDGAVYAIPPSPTGTAAGPQKQAVLSELNPQSSTTPPAGAGASPAGSAGAKQGQTPAPDLAGAPTETVMRQELQHLRGEVSRLQAAAAKRDTELQQIRQAITEGSAAYYRQVDTISARLKTGTMPGSPDLLNDWNQAQAALSREEGAIVQLAGLSAQTDSDGSYAAYLQKSAKLARSLKGGERKDELQLTQLEVDSLTLDAAIRRQSVRFSEEMQRESAALPAKHANLVRLASAIQTGDLHAAGSVLLPSEEPHVAALSSRKMPPSPRKAAKTEAAKAGKPSPAQEPPEGWSTPDPIDAARPLVVVRFDRPDVDYKKAVTYAAGEALKRKSDAAFDVVAISPKGATPEETQQAQDASKKGAEGVIQAMVQAGVPPDHVTLMTGASGHAQGPEVRVFVR